MNCQNQFYLLSKSLPEGEPAVSEKVTRFHVEIVLQRRMLLISFANETDRIEETGLIGPASGPMMFGLPVRKVHCTESKNS